MSHAHGMIGLATLLFAVGMWLSLPRAAWGRMIGAVLVLAGLGLFAAQVPLLGGWINQAIFWILAAVTVIAAVGAVTFRSPVYCAIWFALSLLGTAGLFLFQGAQFLGVATIVVYAGAILVTFLFVLMLAQPRGQTFYDRLSWEAMLSAATGAIMVGILTLAVASIFQYPNAAARPMPRFDTTALKQGILTSEHMARLGGQLFSRYLIAVEIAGTLLLVALVGAVAIVAQAKQLSHSAPGGRSHE